MLAKLSSYTLVGIEAAPVEVEVDVSAASMPKTVLVGLAEAAVRESTHRVERALVNSGYLRPIDRVVINLVPADLKKEAGGLDLPIAGGPGCLSTWAAEPREVAGRPAAPARTSRRCATPVGEQPGPPAALLDRLTHHCHIFEMNGESYRVRELMRAKKGRKAE